MVRGVLYKSGTEEIGDKNSFGYIRRIKKSSLPLTFASARRELFVGLGDLSSVVS